MKKKIFAFLMAGCMLSALLTGCGGTSKEEAEVETETVDETSEAVYMTFDAYTYIGMLSMTEDDGEGGTIVSETGSLDVEGIPGETISEALESSNIVGIEPVCDGEVFEGWMEYERIVTTDEDGFEEYSYEKLSGDTLYSTEELMEKAVPDYQVTYVAKWESVTMEEYAMEYEMAMSGEEESSELSLSLYSDGGSICYGGEEPYEADYGYYSLQEGITVETLLGNGDQIESVEKEGYEFAGWAIYTGDILDWPAEEVTDLAEGEMCFSLGDYGYLLMGNCEVYSESVTTEELLEIVCENTNYYVVATWK